MTGSDDRRDYDLVVFGATGFTGGMTAEYLARRAPSTLRWAIAGRNQSKLDALKARLMSLNPACAAVGSLQASVDDAASLKRMAGASRVLLTTVGPFIDYGEPVVRACIESGTDYIDSTGEPFFVQLLLARYAEPAARQKVRVVPSCGFDSIPADLGALFTVQQLPADRPIQLAGYLSLDARFSGGTQQSAIKSVVPPETPFEVPERAPANGRRVSAGPAKVERQKELGKWSSPFPTVDGPTVLRSATSLDRYGPDFSYSHNALHPSLVVMLLVGLMFGSLGLLARWKPIRALMLKLAMQSGHGPTEAQMQRAWFKLQFIAKCDGRTLRTEVSGGDPGYVETSKMLAESGICLAQDRELLPDRAGVLTPAEAMGERLLARLQQAGLSFRTVT